MKSFLEYLLEDFKRVDEYHFQKRDFSHRDQWNYLKSVLGIMSSGSELSLGTFSTSAVVDFSKGHNKEIVAELSANIDFGKNPPIELSEFNNITKKAKPSFVWQDIFKQPFSHATNRREDEIKQVTDLNTQIAGLGGKVKLKINNNFYYIVSAESVPGNPKADIALIGSENEDSKEQKPCVFLSLKKGLKISDFGGYGGISDKLFAKAEKAKSVTDEDHKTIMKFVKSFKKFIKNNKNKFKGRFSNEKIKPTKNLQLISIYGYESGYGPGNDNNKPFSTHKCNAIVQGDIKLVKKSGYYVLSATEIHEYPEIPDGKGTPIFCARVSNDRDDFGCKGTRFGIFPEGFLSKKHVNNNYER